MGNRDSFASSFGVLVAMAGSAVGLGNLWRFPYLVGTNGGAAFIILYLGCILLLALPIMYSEFIIGRRSQANVFGAFKVLAPKTGWCKVGFIYVLCSIVIISFYSVVGGWTLNYFIKSLAFKFTSTDTAVLDGMFDATVSSSGSSLGYVMLFLFATALILYAGVKNGIEKYTKIMMPMLFVIVIIIAVRSATLPGASAGLKFLFKPDFSKVTAHTFLDALGQAFFSLSVGGGSIMTYASYVKKKANIVGLSAQTAITDTAFAIIAGLAIMPAVFSFGISPEQGPGLVFVTLPYIFAQIPLGSILAIMFFFMLFIAALTSSISLLEVFVAYLNEEFKLGRTVSIVISTAIVAVLGTLCVLSTKIFDSFDKLSANILLPLGGLIVVIFVGWKMSKKDTLDELTSGGIHKFPAVAQNIIYLSIKYIAPIVVAVILTRGLMW